MHRIDLTGTEKGSRVRDCQGYTDVPQALRLRQRCDEEFDTDIQGIHPDWLDVIRATHSKTRRFGTKRACHNQDRHPNAPTLNLGGEGDTQSNLTVFVFSGTFRPETKKKTNTVLPRSQAKLTRVDLPSDTRVLAALDDALVTLQPSSSIWEMF